MNRTGSFALSIVSPLTIVLFTVALARQSALAAEPAESVTFATSAARLEIGRDGNIIGLFDVASGDNLADVSRPLPLARLHGTEQVHPVTAASASGDRLELSFGGFGSAVLRVERHPRWLLLEVLHVAAPTAASLDFIDVPLTLEGEPTEPAAACVLALNLKTNVQALPQASRRLQATCYAKLGMVGARAAVIVCPQDRLRDTIKQVVSANRDLPHSPIGGPWALDAPANRGSYVLDCTGKTGEEQIDAWIELLGAMGIDQLDFHCGRWMRFGDLEPDPKVHPRGIESVKAVVDKLHGADMLAGLHTYAFFVSKESPFVTPVPDPGLAVFDHFTLTEPISADATSLTVRESTADVSTITGFQIRNSVTLRAGNELIVFGGARKQPPFGFDECRRGAYGTKATAHEAGVKVGHLKECFGLFVPDPESPLWTKVIDRTAEVYNQAGFDMIYLDALDGSDILAGGEWAWHYGSKFVFDLARRLSRPALFEMSTFHHHLWYMRSRMGAWDAPARGARPFIELHRMVNRNCERMFLPPHLGWWKIHDWQGLQPERSFPETVEYLLNRCLADDCGLSFIATTPPEEFGKTVLRYGPMIKRYEALRRSGNVSAKMRERLGEPFAEHTLDSESDATPAFRPARYDRHILGRIAPAGNAVQVKNDFADQPLIVRIEPLLSAASYDSPDSVVVEDFSKPHAFSVRKTPAGKRVQLTQTDDGRARLTVDDRPASNPPYAMTGRTFSPCLDLNNKGLGFRVEVDSASGPAEPRRSPLLNVQVKSPLHAHGGFCDRYVRLDFTGRSYVELIEPESDTIPLHDWPYMPKRSEWPNRPDAGMAAAYPTFHIWVSYDKIEELNLWLNELPAGQTSCVIGPIKALPLEPCVLKNPAITLGGRTITFATALQTGQYLECRSPDDCRVYGPKGDVIKKVEVRGDWPVLRAGDNELRLKSASVPEPQPRAAVTVVSFGEPLTE